jgi:hypothetical protein
MQSILESLQKEHISERGRERPHHSASTSDVQDLHHALADIFSLPPLSRLGTHYLCRSSEGLDDGLEVEVIDKEEEMGKGKASEAEDNGSKVG